MHNPIAWLWPIVVAVVVALCANVLFEYIFRPLVKWTGRALLTVATLGTSSLRNALYRNAATRSYFKPALTLLYVLCLASAGAFGWSASIFQRTHFGTPQYLAQKAYNEKIKKYSLQQLSDEGDRLGKESYVTEQRLSDLLITLSGIIMILLFSSYGKDKYSIYLANYFDQMMEICGPAMSEQDRLLMRSKFAQVRTRDDYSDVARTLIKKAASMDDDVKTPYLFLF